MISPELAKELREAGYGYKTDWNMYDKLDKQGLGVIGLPKLHELIEACDVAKSRAKEPHFTLSFFAREWTAFIPNAFSHRDLLEGFVGKGADPETAVANLYLVMHQRVTVTVNANSNPGTA